MATATTNSIAFDSLVASLDTELEARQAGTVIDSSAHAAISLRVDTCDETGLEVSLCASEGCRACKRETSRPVFRLA